MEIHLNFGALLVSSLAYFFLGWAWHSPLLFMKAWVKEMGFPKLSKKEREKRMKGMWKPMLGNFLALLVTAYVFTYVIQYSQAFYKTSGPAGGLMSAFWLWLGFIATTLLNTVLWEGRSWKLFAINASYHLCGLLLMGAILAAWQ
jgi:hypothetical protein